MKRVMKRITELERVINNPLTTMSQRHKARTGLTRLTGAPYTSAELAYEISWISSSRGKYYHNTQFTYRDEDQAHNNLCYELASWL